MNGLSIVSLTLGIVSFSVWFMPLLGIPFAIIGFFVGGTQRLQDPKDPLAHAGTTLCAINLILVVIVAAIWLVAVTFFRT